MSDQTTWRSCRLDPDDVLFFRDGKPSSLGTDHYLHSLFPPHPSTLYGALRTRRLLDGGVELRGLEATTWQQRLGDLTRELGNWGRFGSLELRGPWLVRGLTKDQEEVLLPAPADLAVVLEKEDERVVGEEKRRRIVDVVRYRLEDGAAGGWSHHLGLWQPYRRPSDGWEPPALATAGAWPPGFAPGSAEGELGGRRCRLLGAIVREASLVGGWDVARRTAKPLRRAISTGSVFAFEWLDDPPPEGASALWGSNLCDDFNDEHLSQQGFGLTLSGLCP